jgi:hypothetical protein
VVLGVAIFALKGRRTKINIGHSTRSHNRKLLM